MTAGVTMTLDAYRATMLRQLEQADSYSFLNAVDVYLEKQPDDDPIRLFAVREHLKLGLVQAARDLLDERDGAMRSPELRPVAQTLTKIKAQTLSWSDCHTQFESNLGALESRGVETESIRQDWARRCSEFQLFRDNNQVFQVRARETRGRWQWMPFLGHHPKLDAARPLPDSLQSIMPMPVLFDGLGYGDFFERIYRATLNTFHGYSCALFVVEPMPAMLAALLHLRDWRDLLADSRVFLFVGPSWAAQLEQAFQMNPDLPWPAQVISLMPRQTPSAQSPALLVTELHRRRQVQMDDTWRRVQEQYKNRDATYWASRFEEALSTPDRPLRILSAVSTHTTFLQYSMRDAKQAFERLGHKCVVLTEKTPFDVISPSTFHRAILEHDPDVFFNIDHLRPEFAGVVPENLPIFAWDQDQLPHVFTHANVSRIGPLDFLAGMTKNYFVRIGGRPEQFLYSYMPTNVEQFNGEVLTDEEAARFQCDVSYVSHASQTPKQFHDEERKQYSDPNLIRLLDVMFEQMFPMIRKYHVPGGFVVTTLLREASQRCGVEVTDGALKERLLWWYLWRLGDRIFRHEALEWTAAWARKSRRTLRIYGNGWDKHPTLAEFACGPVANGRDLTCVYRASRINLQLMPAGFVHQRALDGLASGGFFLCRLVPQDVRSSELRRLIELLEQFKIRTIDELLNSSNEEVGSAAAAYFGENWRGMVPREDSVIRNLFINAELPGPDELFPDFRTIVFSSAAEFEARADVYLAGEERRRQIAQSMQRTVIEKFSYVHTMQRFLAAMAGHMAKVGRS